VGAWRRPLFAGGWKESTEADTIVFNLQSPSLFIDIRFPLKRPEYLRAKSGFKELTMDELRCLARQHTFAGYTKIEPKDAKSAAPVATRHHAIDWNYHPKFPRARPNRWRIELKDDGTSFKEFSVALDSQQQAVYMERWALYPNGKGPYLALRRITENAGGDTTGHESLLVIVGNHFAYARDRAHPLPEFGSRLRAGGCANLVDAAYEREDRAKMIHMLDLEGSYGEVYDSSGRASWKIKKSTLPWKEGKQLINPNDAHFLDSRSDDIPEILEVLGSKWKVYECSFTRRELEKMLYVGKSKSSTCTRSKL